MAQIDSLDKYEKISVDVYMVENYGVMLVFSDGEISTHDSAPKAGASLCDKIQKTRKEKGED